MPQFTVSECITIVFTLTVIKCGMAQPNSEEQGADVYQLARTSARPNALIEITNRLSVPMVLLKKDLQFHGHTPLRPAPWNIDPMNFDAFLVSPLWLNKTGTYLSIYGAMVYEIREDQRTIAFALYFCIPDGHARHRFPWFGLEIYANDFERRMRDALEADYMPEGGVMTLNSYYNRFSYASAQKTLRVGNAEYKIIASMKMTSSTTATIKVGVQPAKTYRGAPRAPLISQPAPPEQGPILASSDSPSTSIVSQLQDTSLFSSTDASAHVSTAQSESTSITSEESSSSTSQVTEVASTTIHGITTAPGSLSSSEATTAASSGEVSTIISSTTTHVQGDDSTTSTLGPASDTKETASSTTQEEETTSEKSTPGTTVASEPVTEAMTSSAIIQTTSTATTENNEESSTTTAETVDATTTISKPAAKDDYDYFGEAQPQ